MCPRIFNAVRAVGRVRTAYLFNFEWYAVRTLRYLNSTDGGMSLAGNFSILRHTRLNNLWSTVTSSHFVPPLAS